MKILSYVVLAVLCIIGVLAQNDTTEVDTTTTPSTSTVTESTATSTDIPTTSAEPTTDSSTQTTTVTAEPTTSPQPTTISSTSSSTTSTTTEASTTNAPQPTAPSPDDCTWNVTDGNVTCIRIEMKAIFTIPVEGRIQYIALSQNATTAGSTCTLSNDTQRLVLSEANYNLTMIFVKEANKVYVNETNLEFTLPELSGSGTSDEKLFAVKVGNSYMCKTQANVKLTNVTMEVYDLHVQAFGAEGNANFGAAEECDADDKVSDAVPIAVGCALAALIIIVLIAYLVGRRQSRQRGYQSV